MNASKEPLRCRELVGNRLEGRLPASLLAMRFPGGLLYAPPPVSALECFDAEPRMCGGSLFPQEGCPLARHGREGQDKTANDFGVCVAGPVRPLAAVSIRPCSTHKHLHTTQRSHTGVKQTGRFVLPTHVRTQ